jgi:hypothetical protein
MATGRSSSLLRWRRNNRWRRAWLPLPLHPGRHLSARGVLAWTGFNSDGRHSLPRVEPDGGAAAAANACQGAKHGDGVGAGATLTAVTCHGRAGGSRPCEGSGNNRWLGLASATAPSRPVLLARVVLAWTGFSLDWRHSLPRVESDGGVTPTTPATAQNMACAYGESRACSERRTANRYGLPCRAGSSSPCEGIGNRFAVCTLRSACFCRRAALNGSNGESPCLS